MCWKRFLYLSANEDVWKLKITHTAIKLQTKVKTGRHESAHSFTLGLFRLGVV